MLIAKLKKVQSYLIGSNEDLALEQRLLLLSLLIGTMMGSIGSITNYITTSNILAFLSPLFLAICTTILYYFVRFKNVYKPLAILSSLIGIIGIAVIWVYNGGIDGPNSMVAITILVLALVIVPHKAKLYILLGSLLANIIALLIQYYYPSAVVGYTSEFARWVDYLICTVYSSLFVFLIIKLIHKHYTTEKELVKRHEGVIHQKNEELENNVV